MSCHKTFPLLAKIYPNGEADINHFHAAGGMGFIIKTLLENDYLHTDVTTIAGKMVWRAMRGNQN